MDPSAAVPECIVRSLPPCKTEETIPIVEDSPVVWITYGINIQTKLALVSVAVG